MTITSTDSRVIGIVAVSLALVLGVCPAAVAANLAIPPARRVVSGRSPIAPARPLRIPPGKNKLTTPPKSSGGLTPEESKQLAEAMKRLSPEERKRVARAVKRLTPEGRRQLAQSLKGQVAGNRTASQPINRAR
jgi:hypothetical protein